LTPLPRLVQDCAKSVRLSSRTEPGVRLQSLTYDDDPQRETGSIERSMPSDDSDRPGTAIAGSSATGHKPVDDPRIYLAAERTFLAWVRTSLALMGFGFLIARFAFWTREYALVEAGQPITRPPISPWLGFGMVVVGVYVCVTSAVRHRSYIHALKDGVSNPPRDLRGALILAGILALVGLAMAVHIVLY
jgi:putative membrane protein